MRERWLDEGLLVLGELGINGVRIDRLADRLGVTKGSFYHHFPGMAGYRLELLDHFERRYTTRYIDLVERSGLTDPRDKLNELATVVIAGLDGERLEVAVRGWAAKDDDARSTLERIDGRRLAYVTGLLEAIVPSRMDNRQLGQVLYLTVIGASHVCPALPATQVRELFDRMLGLIEGSVSA